MTQIRTAKKADQKYIISAMVMAFGANPLMRWIYPDAYQYLHHFPRLTLAAVSPAFDCKTATVIQGYSGAALWLPPNIQPDTERLTEQIQHSTFESDQIEILGLLKHLQQYRPTAPHWSLAMLGIEPVKQGCGYGSALIKSGLARCDREGLPVYLEASNANNLNFYQRHGFEVLAKLQIGSSPTIFPMLRQSANAKRHHTITHH